MSPARAAIAACWILVAGCAESRTASVTDGGRAATDGSLRSTCTGGVVVGEACDFSEPCRNYYDFWMGRCGSEEWACEAGRAVYRDFTFACSPIDAGPSRCADYEPPPATTSAMCTRDADCPLGGSCWAPGDTRPYYGAGFCPRECDADAACGAGQVCVALNGGACHQCRAACGSGADCGRWEACASDGHCRPARCEDEGYACPPGATCERGPASDEHGCAIVPCASDGECGCGACIEGRCALGPGRCEPPRP